ncbi:MAG: TIGR04255 family protein [Candidatus Marinimicrobia bacterium]|nr:TIGR04255 family protein [Candidatus Neomarinimicrobiota bacterium]
MAKVQHLSNAPIREALIDIQVEFQEGMTLESFSAFGEAIKNDYPKLGKTWTAEFNLKTENATGGMTSAQTGYVFRSQDGHQVTQTRLEGFTFSRLNNYESWETFRTEAKRLWSLFADILRPLSITRIGCRFINEIQLEAAVNLPDYITAIPPRIDGIPDQVEGFMSRVEVHYDDAPTNAIITQALRIIDDEKVTLLLDIDVFRKITFPGDGLLAWESIEDFREIKNKIFFSSITDKTVEECK